MATEPLTDDVFSARLEALGASIDGLATLVRPLTPDQLRQPAYPSEWTIADVLSHLGAGAVITRIRLDGEVDMPAVWDEWNAKDPDAQAADALRADAELQDRLASLTPDDKAQFRFSMGPVEVDLSTFLGEMRLNEHVVHTWDVAVALDPTATIPTDEAELVVDALGMVTRFAGKPTGTDRTITIRTVAPTRHFALVLRPDGVSLSPGAPIDAPDLELPADALIRLVYGRLDPNHAPTGLESEADLGELRRVFPGF
jgi:uncharacterized protein (TIGR03083 family)